MRNKIYYLLDLHLSCEYISKYSDKYVDIYIQNVNMLLNTYFNVDEQKQLKLSNFDLKIFNDIVCGNMPENISFDGLNEQKLNDFFEKICIMNIKNLENKQMQK